MEMSPPVAAATLERFSRAELTALIHEAMQVLAQKTLADEELEHYTRDPELVIVERNGFNDGYITGYNWPLDNKHWAYTPGGPFVWTAKEYAKTKPEIAIRAFRSQRVHKEWMKGWKAGNLQAKDDERLGIREWSRECVLGGRDYSPVTYRDPPSCVHPAPTLTRDELRSMGVPID